MKLNRNEEFIKMIKIIEELNDIINSIKGDIKDIYDLDTKYTNLIYYIEQEIIKNIESIEELKYPFLLFIVGSGNYGKSTLVNALLQEKIVQMADIPNTWKLDLFIKSKKEKMEIIYEDNTRSIKSLKEGTRLLQEEEKKYKLSRKKVTRLVKEYKSTKNFDIRELKEYKKKLEDKYIYKSNIVQIKYYINKDNILDDFIIVDTPGLNQVLLSNTLDRIKQYYEKSDGVIWIIDAQNIVSKENNKMVKEIEIIDKLHSEKKNRIAVINKVDILRDNDIKNIDKVKKKVQEVYKNKFDEIVFISAKEALEGLINEDDTLIDKSNINTLHKSIDTNFRKVAEENQIKSKYKNMYLMRDNILERIYSYKRELYNDISIYNESQFEQSDKIKDTEIKIKNRLKRIKNRNYQEMEDIEKLKKEVEELQNVYSDELHKLYENLYLKSNITSIDSEKNVDTNVYFVRTKNIVLDYNKNIRINPKNTSLINMVEEILNRINSRSKSYEEIILTDTIIPKINALVDEITEIVEDKLNLISADVNETREKSFSKKHIEYSKIKKHIDYMNEIENIMKKLR